MSELTAETFRELTKGRFFTIKFYKESDGTIRTMNALDRVTAYIKGTGKTVKDGRIVLWDRTFYGKQRKRGLPKDAAGSSSYRSAWPSNVISVKVGGKVHVFQEEVG